MKLTSLVPALIAATGLTIAATAIPASATTFSFNNISGGDTVGDAFAPGFSFDVTDYGGGKVLFKFLNNSSGTNALKQFAFSVDPTVNGLLSGMQVNVNNSGTVLFDSKAQNLSQTENLSSWDGTTFGGGTSGSNSNSVQVGESLGVTFIANFNNVISALTSSKLQVGIHVGSLPNGASDAYVSSYVPKNNTPTPPTQVPEPTVSLAALAGVVVLAKTKSKLRSQKAV